MKNVFPVYSSEEVLQFTYDTTYNLIKAGIKGDLVECGVAAGSQIGAMQEALIDLKEDRIIWGFDSFEGIPYATDDDDSQPEIGEIDKTKLGLLETTGVSSHSIGNVLSNFKLWKLPTDNLKLVKGWFQDTVKPTSKQIKKIALLRLDGDLYESTKIPLQYLLSKVSKGGVVIIDDWQLGGCRKAVLEFIDNTEIVEHLGIAYYVKK